MGVYSVSWVLLTISVLGYGPCSLGPPRSVVLMPLPWLPVMFLMSLASVPARLLPSACSPFRKLDFGALVELDFSRLFGISSRLFGILRQLLRRRLAGQRLAASNMSGYIVSHPSVDNEGVSGSPT